MVLAGYVDTHSKHRRELPLPDFFGCSLRYYPGRYLHLLQSHNPHKEPITERFILSVMAISALIMGITTPSFAAYKTTNFTQQKEITDFDKLRAENLDKVNFDKLREENRNKVDFDKLREENRNKAAKS
jgi:hypothetical protein